MAMHFGVVAPGGSGVVGHDCPRLCAALRNAREAPFGKIRAGSAPHVIGEGGCETARLPPALAIGTASVYNSSP